MFLKNTKMSTRLALGFGSIVFILLIVTVLTTAGINSIISDINKTNTYHNFLSEIKEREVNHLDWLTSLSRGMIEGKPESITVETDAHKCKLGLWYYSDARKQAEAEMPGLTEYLDKIEKPHQQLHYSAEGIRAALGKGLQGRVDAQKIFFSETIPELLEVRKNLNAINGAVNNIVAVSDEKMISGANRTIASSITLSAMALVIVSLFSFFFIRGIMRQLGGEPAYIIDAIKKVADGDLTVDIHLKSGDKRSIIFIFRTMANDLEKMVKETLFSVKNLHNAVNEISSGNMNLSQRTSEQAAALEEIVSTIEEASSSITRTAENAVEAKTLSNESSKLATKGGALVDEAVNSINNINHASKKINEIIGVINDIAFQTNLLALNAAVEAARAGEQGRGFAVVAGEVRNLAQRSSTASKEITSLIQTSIQMISEGTDKVNSSGKILTEIIESVKVVNNRVAEIAAASEEQKRGMEQINRAISEMDSMTQQNASLVEENASASEQMSNQAQDVLQMMERFRVRD